MSFISDNIRKMYIIGDKNEIEISIFQDQDVQTDEGCVACPEERADQPMWNAHHDKQKHG